MGVISDLFTPRHQRASVVLEPAEVSHPAVQEPEYADHHAYHPLPVLTLRPWDYGHGLDADAAGYGFTAPDGKIWPANRCLWSTWDELGVLVINVVGPKYHLNDVQDPSFDPGQPLRLFPEPDNPYDAHAIAIRNWAADKTAGYVKKGSTTRLRNLLRGEDVRVMALNCRYDAPPPRGRRASLKAAIFRPDRLTGAEQIPPHPKVL